MVIPGRGLLPASPESITTSLAEPSPSARLDTVTMDSRLAAARRPGM